MYEGIDPRSLRVGDQYQYDERHFTGNVTVIENLCEEGDNEIGAWIGFRVRIDEVLYGENERIKPGYEFTHGFREGYEHYGGWRIKPVGSQTEYFH